MILHVPTFARRVALALCLALPGCGGAPVRTSPGCPEGQVMCTVSRGTPSGEGPSSACTAPCNPGESFGAGIGRCSSDGCPVYYLP
jgi:hypothetical protein